MKANQPKFYIEIRLSQSGVKHQLPFYSNQKVAHLQERIRQLYKIQVSDQLLITKNGLIPRPEEDLKSINSEKQKTYAPDAQNINNLKRLPCVYVFSRKSLRSSSEISKTPRTLDIENDLNAKCVQRAGLNLKSQFKPLEQLYSKQDIRRLQEINPNILSCLGNILEADEGLLSNLNRYEQLKMILSEQSEQILTQYKSINPLFSSLKITGNSIKNSIEICQHAVQNIKQKREQNVRATFQQLKKMNLDDKYFTHDQTKIKELCSLIFSNKFNESDQRLKEFELKLIEIQNVIEDKTSQGSKSSEWRNFYVNKMKKKDVENISTKMQEFNARLVEIKLKRESSLRELYEKISKYLKNQNDNFSREYLSNAHLKRVEQQISIYSKNSSITLLEENNYFVKTYIDSYLHKYKNENTFFKEAYGKYQQFETTFVITSKDINTIQEHLKIMNKEMDQVFDDSREDYEFTKLEISKRLDFFNQIQDLIRQGAELFEEEEIRRRAYVSNSRTAKTKEIFPLLEHQNQSRFLLGPAVGAQSFIREAILDSKQQDQGEKMLQSIQHLTNQIIDYKRMKENCEPNKSQTKISNLQQILIKTAKISQQIYYNKLQQQIQKYESVIASMNQLKSNHETAIKMLKEENKELKLVTKSEMESQRDMRKNKSDQDEFRKKDYRSEPSEFNKLKDDMGRKDDQVRFLQTEIKEMRNTIQNQKQQNADLMRQLNVEKGEKSKIRQQLQRLSQRLQEAERLYRAALSEKQNIERQMGEGVHHTNHCDDQIIDLQSQIEIMENNLSEQAGELEHERMMLMQLQIAMKNKELEIIRLEKQIEQLQQTLRWHQEDKNRSDGLNRSVGVDQSRDADVTVQDYTDTQFQNPSHEVIQLRDENSRLREEIDELSYELKLIIQKQTIEVETETDKDILSLEEVGVGRLLIFIPYSNGIYVPLVMIDSLKTEFQLSKTSISSYKSCYFLNTSNFSLKTRDLLNQCAFILIGKVSKIVEMVAEGQNSYGVKHGEVYYLLDVDKPQGMIGFEDDDPSLKNYVFL